MAEVFSDIQKLRRIRRNSCWQERLLYPLLLQDDLHGIAYNRLVGRSDYRRKKFFGLGNELRFPTVKRLMKKLRRSSSLSIAGCISELQVIQKIAIIVFDLILPIRSEQPTIETMNEWNSYQSIHSVFPSMEDNICSFNSCLDLTIPCSVHPEELIRVFRRRIADISFLHLLRLFFHRNLITSNLPTIFYSGENPFHCFLWNFHLHEFEHSLLNTWEQIHRFRSNEFWFFFDRIGFAQKIGKGHSARELIVKRNDSIHYVRYRNNIIIGVCIRTGLLIENWKFFFNILWGKYFHSWFEPYRISVTNLSRNPLSFLGYTFRTESKSVPIRIQLVNHSINTNLVIKKFCSIVPIIPLIGVLAKEKFCDISGRPICKLPWTTLSDNEIFERFDRITKNISCYYSGCSEKKGLHQTQYILRFSCAKTLACKHKSTIRTVWRKYGSSFTTNFVSPKETELITSNSWRVDSLKIKIWYLNIVQMNYFSNILHRLGGHTRFQVVNEIHEESRMR